MMPWISRTSLIKGTILALLLASVLGLRFGVVPGSRSGPIVVATGFYFLAVNYLLFFYSLLRTLSAIAIKPIIHRNLYGILACIALTFIVHLMEPHRFKVLNDEFALLNNSMSMHLYQKAGIMGQADLIEGDIVHQSITADKRSLSFQFLLSLVHRISGYRPQNAFVLNFFLTTGFFLSLYGFLNLLQGNRTLSLIGVILTACIPLFAQVATSGAYDLLNVAALLIFLLAGTAYVKSPDEKHQALFVAVALLLAQVRYESLLYLISLGIVTLVVWVRNRQIRFSWMATISPVFLFVPLMANAHMFTHEALQDGGIRGSEIAFISFHHIQSNLVDAARYFFNPYSSATNSVVVSTFSLIGIIWLSAKLIQNRRSPLTPSLLVYLAGFFITVMCFLLMTMNFWGKVTDPMASRFTMPLYVMGIVAGVICLSEFCSQKYIHRRILAAVLALFTITVVPRFLGFTQTPPMIQSEYQHWLLDFARSKGPKPILYSCDGTLGLVSHNKAAIPVRALNISPDAIARVMESGIYDAIYVFDLVVRDDDSGSWHRMPGASGLDTALYAAEVEQEVYFNDRTRARAYRLTGIYAH